MVPIWVILTTKKVFFVGIKPPTRELVFAPEHRSKTIFSEFSNKFHAFSSFFLLLTQKMLKTDILTSIWSVQHPNAVQNIQHSLLLSKFYFVPFRKMENISSPPKKYSHSYSCSKIIFYLLNTGLVTGLLSPPPHPLPLKSI